jgi:hypothetical protein
MHHRLARLFFNWQTMPFVKWYGMQCATYEAGATGGQIDSGNNKMVEA